MQSSWAQTSHLCFKDTSFRAPSWLGPEDPQGRQLLICGGPEFQGHPGWVYRADTPKKFEPLWRCLSNTTKENKAKIGNKVAPGRMLSLQRPWRPCDVGRQTDTVGRSMNRWHGTDTERDMPKRKGRSKEETWPTSPRNQRTVSHQTSTDPTCRQAGRQRNKTTGVPEWLGR